LECRPEEASPRTTSPGSGRGRGRGGRRRTRRPGGGAGHVVLVGLRAARGARRSPHRPGRPGPARRLGDAADDGRDPLGDDLAPRDVVGHEERLGAAHDEVVDDHPDEVEADGVVNVERLGDGDLGAHAVGGRGEHRAVQRGQSRRRRTVPRSRPRPPSTSGRVALATEAFINSTALSPASTSTPAAAYVICSVTGAPTASATTSTGPLRVRQRLLPSLSSSGSGTG
jgi:hypothetical protein